MLIECQLKLFYHNVTQCDYIRKLKLAEPRASLSNRKREFISKSIVFETQAIGYRDIRTLDPINKTVIFFKC